MGELRVICFEGDTKHIWDPDNKDQTDAVEKLFKELIKKGYKAWRVDDKGEKAREMNFFDRSAGKVILTPKLKGG